MTCHRCSKELDADSAFCRYCGAQVQQFESSKRRLTRIPAEGKLGGVCAGLARYVDTDPTVVRLAWIILSVVPGFVIGGLIDYQDTKGVTKVPILGDILRKIAVPELYLAKPRPVVERDGLILMVDDERIPLNGETPQMRRVRFRTLGCYPLTGAVERAACTVEEIVAEMLVTTTSERQGRAIDRDAGAASMEKKKQEGYF